MGDETEDDIKAGRHDAIKARHHDRAQPDYAGYAYNAPQTPTLDLLLCKQSGKRSDRLLPTAVAANDAGANSDAQVSRHHLSTLISNSQGIIVLCEATDAIADVQKRTDIPMGDAEHHL